MQLKALTIKRVDGTYTRALYPLHLLVLSHLIGHIRDLNNEAVSSTEAIKIFLNISPTDSWQKIC